MKIPLANPSKELNKIKKFNPRFVTELNSGNYIGGENFRYQSPCNQCEIVLQQIF